MLYELLVTLLSVTTLTCSSLVSLVEHVTKCVSHKLLSVMKKFRLTSRLFPFKAYLTILYQIKIYVPYSDNSFHYQYWFWSVVFIEFWTNSLQPFTDHFKAAQST